MPLHRIYAPPDLFSKDEKREIVDSLVEHYTSRGLPAFLVITLFCPIDAEDFFIGAQNHSERAQEKGKPFVRIVSQHLARTMNTKEIRQNGTNLLEARFRKVLERKGCEWEIHIEEPPADLWRLSGHAYPAPRTDAEAEWKKRNEPVAYEGPTMADYLYEQNTKA
ncbi:hypothetical protein BCV70DRAFT_271 [Testicularia cyperi]|uniref:Tautomerase cis-CaaD-like domain-containing protein n=1 Tax=Testicularia cyperi TaxID=1882483 RepID=A0A317XX34_9BASI|nr:hypothetical protein BCV70DRAFT_271 [Testicularia cyperi]